MMLLDLTQLKSEVTVAELLEELVPPSEFSKVSFASYIPDDAFPSQTAAAQKTQDFISRVNRQRDESIGIYLDGGFGVGKTHLLASAYHASKVRTAFGPFLSFTSIIGYLGFQEAISVFGKYKFICIDEFELDDPGDTMIMSRFLKELASKGISFAATSNTPPNALGEGRFASDNFQREIASVANRFAMIRIDGEDYRHRSKEYDFKTLSQLDLDSYTDSGVRALSTSFGELLDYLASIHQSRYVKLAEQFDVLLISDLFEIQDQFQGIRLVSFIDRCYEAGISLRSTGRTPAEIFRADHLQGAYQKKYRRCLSRLFAMASR